jgi:hypothetical protein
VKWKSEAERWETAPTSGDVGWDISEDDPRCQEWLGSSAKLVTTLHAMSRGWCKGNLTNLRRELHSSLAKGNLK